MKLNEEQYSELIDKLADEIIEGGMEVVAAEEEPSKEEAVKSLIEAKKKEIADREEKEEKKDDEAEMAEKAAAVYEYAINKIAACEAYYQEGTNEQEACLEILAEAGILTEDGIDKEAAEADEETADIVNKIAEAYEEAGSMVIAAQEKYAEAYEEASAALEVLAELGYEFE
ncbi:MAG: hypothetical protein ACRCX2_23160 [Paraclostridium sp.]